MVTTGKTSDISNLCRFGFYQWVYYWDNRHKFSEQKKIICRALGPTNYEGNLMAQYILQANGIVVPRRTVKAIPSKHLRNQVLQDKMKVYDSCIKEKLGDSMKIPVVRDQHTPREWIPKEEDATKPHTMPDNDICLDNFNVSLTYSLVNDEVLLHRVEADDEPLVKARVIRHLTEKNGNLIGYANKEINMNTLI